MVTVKRLNVVLRVEDQELQKYLNLGYSQVDPNDINVVIKAAIPRDPTSLRVAFVENHKRIAELEVALAEKDKALKALEKKLSKKTKETE